MFYTYAHYRPDGTVFYIGKGSNTRAYSNKGRNVRWNRIVKKEKHFNVEVLASWATEKEAFVHEMFLISTFKNMGFDLVNATDGGEGAKGFKHTEAHKERLRARMLLNNPMSNQTTKENHRKALLFAMQRPEIKIKQRNSRLGKKMSEDTREKCRIAHLGKNVRGEGSSAKKVLHGGTIYQCIKDYADAIGINHKTAYTRISRDPLRWGIGFLEQTEVGA